MLSSPLLLGPVFWMLFSVILLPVACYFPRSSFLADPSPATHWGKGGPEQGNFPPHSAFSNNSNPSFPVEGFSGCQHYKSFLPFFSLIYFFSFFFFFPQKDALRYADSSRCQLKSASGSSTSPVTFSNASRGVTAPPVRFPRVDAVGSTTEHLFFPIKMCKIIKPELMWRLEILVPNNRIVYNPSLLLTC